VNLDLFADIETGVEGAKASSKSTHGAALANQPLAERLRPTTLDELQGQVDAIGPELFAKGHRSR